MLHANNNSQGPAEFQQEVDVLSKLRHPNHITLIGACPKSRTLVYEYVPNGSLEDRLRCKHNKAPLSWQTRIRIASELCSALGFLHGSRPYSIVHGDLKPSNVRLMQTLLASLVTLEFAVYYPILRLQVTVMILRIVAELFQRELHMDPEFVVSGVLTPKSDVYSLAIIGLRLLTGRTALGIRKEVRYALDTGNFKNLLDPLAGDWPFMQGEQLAHLALRCCELNRKNRPDLRSDAWKILEAISACSGGTYCSFKLGYERSDQPPSYFTCPIFQEMMLDPYIAADGFSYEKP